MTVLEQIDPVEHADITIRRAIVDLYELLAETRDVQAAMTLADQVSTYINALSTLQDHARTRADRLTGRTRA